MPKNTKQKCRKIQNKSAEKYKMVNQMNAELLKQGFLVVKGKIPKEYFDAKYYGGSHPVEVGA